MKNIDKKAIKAIDGLLTQISTEALTRNIMSGRDVDLEDCQVYFIDKGHTFIIDALKVIKIARSNIEYSKLISLANADWSDML